MQVAGVPLSGVNHVDEDEEDEDQDEAEQKSKRGNKAEDEKPPTQN